MARKGFYFGTKGHMVSVPYPAFNAAFTREGWTTGATTLQGGAWVRRSKASHMVYNMSWDLASRDDLRPITDFAEGIYGDGLIYFLDPMTMDKNVMPQGWGFPPQAIDDGPILWGDKRPTRVNTSTNTHRYPIHSAKYTLTSGTEGREVFIPNIPGHIIHIGAHGLKTNTAAVQVSEGSEAFTALPLLPVTSATRVNKSYTSQDGIRVRLGGVGTITLASVIAQVLPTGVTPATGAFISGQGHSGCRFAEEPSVTAYSAALDKVGMTALLIETGATETWI